MTAIKDPNDYIVVNFVKGFGPISQQIDNSFGFLRIVSMLHYKINYGDEGMRA